MQFLRRKKERLSCTVIVFLVQRPEQFTNEKGALIEYHARARRQLEMYLHTILSDVLMGHGTMLKRLLQWKADYGRCLQFGR